MLSNCCVHDLNVKFTPLSFLSPPPPLRPSSHYHFSLSPPSFPFHKLSPLLRGGCWDERGESGGEREQEWSDVESRGGRGMEKRFPPPPPPSLPHQMQRVCGWMVAGRRRRNRNRRRWYTTALTPRPLRLQKREDFLRRLLSACFICAFYTCIL